MASRQGYVKHKQKQYEPEENVQEERRQSLPVKDESKDVASSEVINYCHGWLAAPILQGGVSKTTRQRAASTCCLCVRACVRAKARPSVGCYLRASERIHVLNKITIVKQLSYPYSAALSK
ncbi:hypothetical protein Trydic_g10894 [Trypoxylus dichotomus]